MLRIPAGRLPRDAAARHAALRDYFCDKDASATRAGDGWELALAWAGGAERHVDPEIERHLGPWDVAGLPGMALARRRQGRVLTALYDTWTLHSWSEWLARTVTPADAAVTVLHLDDHRDLGSPRLYRAGDGLRDLITDRPFDMRDPASVRAACESGAVGMGSFLTPFLLAHPNADVRQLGQLPKVGATVDHLVRAAIQTDDLIRPGAERPAIRLEPAGGGPGPGRYRATSDLADWLADIGDGPVLLHVDMDYFNNRYDGDGDWSAREPRLDPPLEDILDRIDRVTGAMRAAGLLGRIEDAVVAFSPGFFPAEFWAASEARLRAGLEELYG